MSAPHPLRQKILEGDSDGAISDILNAYRKSGACMKSTAKILKCALATLYGLVYDLDLKGALAEIKCEAENQGWGHGLNRLGPGGKLNVA